MAEIRCPMCGKPNPAELDVCQYCEARLKPLTDELARSQPPIHPGEEPTEQDTGQLEPVLPQWLRDVRQQARDSTEEIEEDESAEQIPVEEEAPQPEESADLLAGLQSQSEDEDEIPDWLAGLRGEGEQVSDKESSTEEDDLAALKNMLGEDTPTPQESEASALPGWISDLDAEEGGEKPAQAESQTSASDSDFGWDADFDTDSASQEDSAEGDTSFETELPAWLQGVDETPKEGEGTPPAGLGAEESPFVTDSEEAVSPASEGELPDWLASLGEEEAEPTPQEGAEQPAAESATDWLSSLGEETAEAASQQDTGSQAESATDWLASLGEESTESVQEPETPQPAAEDEVPDWATSALPEDEAQPVGESEELPDWLSSLDSEETSQEEGEAAPTAESTETAQPGTEDEVPDWVSSLGGTGSEKDSQQTNEESAAVSDVPDWASQTVEENGEIAAQEEPQPAVEGELPDWLSSLGDEETPQEEDELAPPAESIESAQPVAEDEMPDWLSSISEGATETEQAVEPVEAPVPTPAEPVDESEQAIPFVDDEGEPISTEDMESIFSMDMPDWLSGSDEAAEEAVAPSAEGVPGGDLETAELPSWVQAMRPVESVISETEGGPAEEQPIEERGPLAGLRGVLPAVPGVGPSSTPKAYSIKLEASAEQQANATMLEQMLAEEEHPKPVSAQQMVLTQRILRWVIAVLLLLVVGGTIFSGTQINQMPTSAHLETSAVLTYIQSSLPMDAPVLLIFDYDAAMAGELESVAAPLIDHMLTLKAPRLSLVASTPTGSGLAERFIAPFTRSDNHNYQRGLNFINLGYLPGGAAGVLAFSENPVNTKPLTTTGENAWTTPVLAGVENLSEFKAIILLTNDIETAHIWIEQTENTRGEARLLVVSSARSGPMIQPYYQSGQVDGLVTGLDGSAPIEQVNSGRPGVVRRYWDAYGFSLLTATALIVLGSIWSLFSGWQARRKDSGDE